MLSRDFLELVVGGALVALALAGAVVGVSGGGALWAAVGPASASASDDGGVAEFIDDLCAADVAMLWGVEVDHLKETLIKVVVSWPTRQDSSRTGK
jgi:hypothetical protein